MSDPFDIIDDLEDESPVVESSQSTDEELREADYIATIKWVAAQFGSESRPKPSEAPSPEAYGMFLAFSDRPDQFFKEMYRTLVPSKQMIEARQRAESRSRSLLSRIDEVQEAALLAYAEAERKKDSIVGR